MNLEKLTEFMTPHEALSFMIAMQTKDFQTREEAYNRATKQMGSSIESSNYHEHRDDKYRKVCEEQIKRHDLKYELFLPDVVGGILW